MYLCYVDESGTGLKDPKFADWSLCPERENPLRVAAGSLASRNRRIHFSTL